VGPQRWRQPRPEKHRSEVRGSQGNRSHPGSALVTSSSPKRLFAGDPGEPASISLSPDPRSFGHLLGFPVWAEPTRQPLPRRGTTRGRAAGKRWSLTLLLVTGLLGGFSPKSAGAARGSRSRCHGHPPPRGSRCRATRGAEVDPRGGGGGDSRGSLTRYQTPRMMVPVRTWQQRQQLLE